jgi:TrmH family RNA methyltransferase
MDTPRGRELIQGFEARNIPVEHVTDREFASAAETESPQGVLAVAAVPDGGYDRLVQASAIRLLVLDGVQDPGNVGTILRTAAALGVTATVALPGTVDLWNAKVVRSSMGAHFRHLAFHSSWDDLDQFRSERRISLWGADAGGDSVESLAAPADLGLMVGNEGAGLSAEARGRSDRMVALRIAPEVESLNVAVATGILLHTLRA